MKQTLEAMKSLTNPTNKKLSHEEIAGYYQKTKNPIYLAESFVKLHPLIFKISSKYFGLTSADIASFSLEQLDICLLSFDAEAGCKFITYFYTYLNNKFRMETEALAYLMRKANNSPEYIDANESFDLPIIENEYSSIELLIDIMNSNKLSKIEKQYCKLVMLGYTGSDISRIMKCTQSCTTNRKMAIKRKLTLSI